LGTAGSDIGATILQGKPSLLGSAAIGLPLNVNDDGFLQPLSNFSVSGLNNIPLQPLGFNTPIPGDRTSMAIMGSSMPVMGSSMPFMGSSMPFMGSSTLNKLDGLSDQKISINITNPSKDAAKNEMNKTPQTVLQMAAKNEMNKTPQPVLPMAENAVPPKA